MTSQLSHSESRIEPWLTREVVPHEANDGCTIFYDVEPVPQSYPDWVRVYDQLFDITESKFTLLIDRAVYSVESREDLLAWREGFIAALRLIKKHQDNDSKAT